MAVGGNHQPREPHHPNPRVDREHVADLLGVELDQVRVQLGELLFTDPTNDLLATRAEYLSGNVRTKLDAAREAAAERPELHCLLWILFGR